MKKICVCILFTVLCIAAIPVSAQESENNSSVTRTSNGCAVSGLEILRGMASIAAEVVSDGCSTEKASEKYENFSRFWKYYSENIN